MRNIENTAVNDLIARASGGRRVSSESMAAMDDDADGDPDADPAQLTLPVAMPVAAPFDPTGGFAAGKAGKVPTPHLASLEERRQTLAYPVVHRGPAVAASPEWPPGTAPEFLEPASPRRLYELASQVERSETGGGDPHGFAGGAGGKAPRGIERSETGGRVPSGINQERLVPTFQMRRPSEVRSVVGKLVFPIALLVSVGIVVGAYVAFSGDRSAARKDLAAATAAPAEAPVAAPAAAPIAPPAPSLPAAPAVPAVTSATGAAPPIVHSLASAPAPAPAVPAAPAAPASPELVDVRIDSIPAGATVMLVDRGRTQLIGNTPVDTAIDPSRDYDLVFTSASAPPHVEHLDPRTTRRVEVVLGNHDGADHPADAPPRRVEHAAIEHAAIEHAAIEHAAVEHTPARSRPRPEPRAEPRAEARAEARIEPPVGQGTLMISSKPPCEIVIDGRTTGLTTPQRAISLSAGNHRITLLNSEKSIHKVVNVQIIANTTAKIIEDLMQ